VLNPVRAGIVEQPGDWRWSSYLATIGETEKSDWLETNWILGQFSRAKKRAEEAYKRFVADGVGGPSPWRDLQGQIWLGEKAFFGEDGKNNREGEFRGSSIGADCTEPTDKSRYF